MTAFGVVTGRMTNEDGEPMVSAQVAALQRPSEEELEDEGASPSRKTRPVVSHLSVWPRHVSGACEVWRVSGQRRSQIGTTSRHAIRTRSQNDATDDGQVWSRVG